MTTATTSATTTISAALNLIETKKQNLRKAFDDLHSQSSAVNSFNLTWSDIDSHFTSLQNSLNDKFQLLQTLSLDNSIEIAENSEKSPKIAKAEAGKAETGGKIEKPNAGKAEKGVKIAKSIAGKSAKSAAAKAGDIERSTVGKGKKFKKLYFGNDGGKDVVPARDELRNFCEKMDGLGLMKYVTSAGKSDEERGKMKKEIPDAIKCAPDPAAMVVDTLVEFKPFLVGKVSKEEGEFRFRGICMTLLEELWKLGAEVREEVKEKAMKLAKEWEGKVESLVGDEKQFGVLLFLQLVAAYGLDEGFGVEKVIDYVVLVAKRRLTIELCKAIVPEDRITDLIERLIRDGKQIMAVKFSFEFGKTDKVSPVSLLKQYRENSKNEAKNILKIGKNSMKSQNEAVMKEVSALRAIIKCIEDYNLEPEYPKHTLVNLVEKLEKEKASKKRPAAFTSPNSQLPVKTQKTLNSNGLQNAESAWNSHKNVVTLQSSYPPTAGFLPDHPLDPHLPLRNFSLPQNGESSWSNHTNGVTSLPPYPHSAPTLPDRPMQYPAPLAGVNSASWLNHGPGVPYIDSTTTPYGLTGLSLGLNSNPTPSGPHFYPRGL